MKVPQLFLVSLLYLIPFVFYGLDFSTISPLFKSLGSFLSKNPKKCEGFLFLNCFNIDNNNKKKCS